MEFEVDKKYVDKNRIKRVEIEYQDMNYIIANFIEKVIDINGELREFSIDDNKLVDIEKKIWEYENIDEYDYWPDKSKDHAPMATMWRIAWWDMNDNYHHKSGATKYPDDLMSLVDELKKV